MTGAEIRVTASRQPPEGWDAAIPRSGAGMLQTAFWGSLLERLGQGTPLYLVAERQGQAGPAPASGG